MSISEIRLTGDDCTVKEIKSKRMRMDASCNAHEEDEKCKINKVLA
jgi:hypothetical protein